MGSDLAGALDHHLLVEPTKAQQWNTLTRLRLGLGGLGSGNFLCPKVE